MSTPLPPTFQNYWSRLSVRQRGTVIIAIPVVCLIVTLAVSIWLQRSGLAAQNQVERVERILAETKDLTKRLVDAEASVRGYDITGEVNYLQPYDAAVANLPASFAALNQLVTDPQQQQRLATIEQLSAQKLDILQRNLITRNRLDQPLVTNPELNALLTQGQAVMTQLRQQTSTFVSLEEQRLAQRRQNLQRQEIITLAVLFLTALVGIVAGLFAKYLFDNLDQELEERREKLNESRTRLQAIVDNVADGILIFRSDGLIESLNPAAQKIFGYDSAAVTGQKLPQLLSKPFQDSQDLLPQLLDASAEKTPQLLSGHHRSGETFLVEMAVSQVYLNRQQWLIGVLRDVTQQKQTAEKLRLYAEEQAHTNRALAHTARILRRRNQELDQFAYVVSHDLKAPLRAIANLSEWLEEDLADKLTPDTRHQMNLLRGRVHRMEALITGLLQYSRVGRIEGQPETVTVADLLGEIIDSLAPGPDIEITVKPGMPVLVTERLLLQQVFTNLISNAIKHHDRQPGDSPAQIQIASQDQGEFYQFAVSDDGPGIDPQYHDKIFGIFQTLEARDKTENTGIGLSLVKKIVESQGGEISIESGVQLGTTFYFQWPQAMHPQRIMES